MLWVAAVFVVGLAVLVGSSLSQTDPPRVFVEIAGLERRAGPDAAEAGVAGYQAVMGRPFDLLVSVDVPSFVRIRYGDTAIDEVAQDLLVSLLPEPGAASVVVEAEDAAGRVALVEVTVHGSWPPDPVIVSPEALTVGEALTARLDWGGEPHRRPRLAVSDAWLELDGERLATLPVDDGLVALAPVPLGSSSGARTLRGVVVDERGEAHVRDAVIRVLDNPNPVQELRVAATTLSLVTPEGRALEAEALATAFAAVWPRPRWSEPFVLPLQGRATSGFGLPRRYAPGGPVSYHLGTDIAAPTGTPIVATNAGVVRVAGMYPIKGGLVVLDHGFGVTSLYFHQSVIHVGEGDVVERGQVIGEVGSTGLSTGPHLHWEMRVDGTPTAPLAWVDRHWPGTPIVDVGGD